MILSLLFILMSISHKILCEASFGRTNSRKRFNTGYENNLFPKGSLLLKKNEECSIAKKLP
jgi:hypothetical protein